MKFEIGDKVKIIKSNTFSLPKSWDLNLIGEIVDYNYNGWDYTVKFDKQYPFTHDCQGKYEKKLYRCYNKSGLKLAEIKKGNDMEFKISDIKTGDFVETKFGKGIVVNGILVYKNGSFDHIETLTKEHIIKVKRNLKSFDELNSMYEFGDVIYDKNKKTFDRKAWIDKYLKLANLDKSIITAYSHSRVTVINPETGKSVTTICSPTDTYDKNTGTAVAYAKYLGEKIPKEI